MTPNDNMARFQKNGITQGLLALSMMVTLTCCAQQQTVVKAAYAFDVVRIPGNIPVGDDGQPLSKVFDTSTVLYIETTNTKISWDTAWIGERAFVPDAMIVSQVPVDAGVSKAGNEKVILSPAAGNIIWKIQLITVEGVHRAPRKTVQAGVLIRGRAGKQVFWKTISNRTELQSVPSV
jgi:hypothetical protein